MVLKLISILLPWSLRRWVLNKFFKFEIHPSARIGLAWVFPDKLKMAALTRIDHFTVAIHLDTIELGENSTIGRGNWITGFSSKTNSLHFKHQPDRKSELIVGRSSAITKNHHIDCTSTITIGSFSTIAGYHSQLLTHSIDVVESRQNSTPITIGDYAFVGTNVVILGGASLPSRSVLGAKSLLNKVFTEEFTLYGGVPAKAVSMITKEAKYFQRTKGFVV
ncbi:MAG: acyltransferase [Ferruginibacter sp.]|nr:acyltransferase [Ferruginibacter sp.]